MELTQERVKELFSYDGKNLRWKVSPRNGVNIGSIAGNNSNGYRAVGIDGKYYQAHCLVWFYHYGCWPRTQLDHINGKRMDNRIKNLREVDQQGNARNRGTSCNNLSGVKGVYFNKERQKWIAQITINRKTKYLGIYKNFADAVQARYDAEVELGWLGCDSINNMGSAYSYLKGK